MRDDRERLLDIKEAIENVQKYASHGREAFRNDELIEAGGDRILERTCI